MAAIIMEGVLFVALVVAAGTLLFWPDDLHPARQVSGPNPQSQSDRARGGAHLSHSRRAHGGGDGSPALG